MNECENGCWVCYRWCVDQRYLQICHMCLNLGWEEQFYLSQQSRSELSESILLLVQKSRSRSVHAGSLWFTKSERVPSAHDQSLTAVSTRGVWLGICLKNLRQ